MEKLVIIILTLAIMVFAIPNQDAEQPSTPVVEMPQTALTEQIEETPEKNTGNADVGEAEESAKINGASIPTEIKPTTKEQTGVEEAPARTDKPMKSEPEETVKCVDEGDQSLAEYKPQIGLQLNPFESAPPAVIIDQSVEDLIGEGEERPGEGKQF